MLETRPNAHRASLAAVAAEISGASTYSLASERIA